MTTIRSVRWRPKISRAAERYREKYGRLPDTCYVHPRVVADPTGI